MVFEGLRLGRGKMMISMMLRRDVFGWKGEEAEILLTPLLRQVTQVVFPKIIGALGQGDVVRRVSDIFRTC